MYLLLPNASRKRTRMGWEFVADFYATKIQRILGPSWATC